jgi:hypothetical protein
MDEPLAVFEKIKMNLAVAEHRLDLECARAVGADDYEALLAVSAKYDRLLKIVNDLGDEIHALVEK